MPNFEAFARNLASRYISLCNTLVLESINLLKKMQNYA